MAWQSPSLSEYFALQSKGKGNEPLDIVNGPECELLTDDDMAQLMAEAMHGNSEWLKAGNESVVGKGLHTKECCDDFEDLDYGLLRRHASYLVENVTIPSPILIRPASAPPCGPVLGEETSCWPSHDFALACSQRVNKEYLTESEGRRASIFDETHSPTDCDFMNASSPPQPHISPSLPMPTELQDRVMQGTTTTATWPRPTALKLLRDFRMQADNWQVVSA